MNTEQINKLLNRETLATIFPKDRSDAFFDALFGDASEGSYDIELALQSVQKNTLNLELLLHQRPGCCLACNLTQGLPQVFSRHPIINIKGVVKAIDELLGDEGSCGEWSLGYTQQHSNELHAIPLTIALN